MLTAQQVADALNASGLDTPEKFTGFLAQAGPLIERNNLLSQVEKLRIEAADLAAQKQSEIKTILDQIAVLEAQMRG